MLNCCGYYNRKGRRSPSSNTDGSTTGMEADLGRVAEGGTVWTGVLGAVRGGDREARELRLEDIRDVLDSGLEHYLFAAAGEPVERASPSCADG